MNAHEQGEPRTVRILLVEDNRDFARLVELFLRKHEPEQFEVVWKANGPEALAELARDPDFDVILMDYFLPGQNGLEITRILQDQQVKIPVVFLTVNKDFDLAVEVMKLGVEDYLVKEEIPTPVLPRTILSVLERQALRLELTKLEITQKRLEAISDIVLQITREIRLPLDALRLSVTELLSSHDSDNLKTYLTIIRDNLERIEQKIAKLKDLKTDRTVPYIKDIRMLDLS
ncbi:MAG: response regulator [Bacteroidota bacterium]